MTVNPTFSSCTKQGIIRCCHRKLNTDKNGTRHFSLHLLPSFVRIRTYSCFSVYFCAIGHWLATIDRSGVGGTSLLRFPACGWRPVVRGTPRGRGKELMHTRRYTVGEGGRCLRTHRSNALLTLLQNYQHKTEESGGCHGVKLKLRGKLS